MIRGQARHALIVGAAPAPAGEAEYARVIAAADWVVAADAGAALCRAAGRVCDLCVGDMDSVDSDTLEWLEANGVPVCRYPSEKDASDLDLALEAAREAGATRLDITAAFHARLDHTIASFGTLVRAADLNARALEPDFTAYALDASSTPTLELAEEPGTTISLFAVDRETMVSVSGVRYPLVQALLPRHTSLGLSNLAVDPVQLLEVHAGRVLCVVPRM